MFNKDGSFPTAEYTFKLPSTVTSVGDIEASENTDVLSAIKAEYDMSTRTVKLTVQLGNWNDYKGFFELVKKELNQTNHKIEVKIPFKAISASSDLGKLTGSGKCELYKVSGLFKGKIVNITTDNIEHELKA